MKLFFFKNISRKLHEIIHKNKVYKIIVEKSCKHLLTEVQNVMLC